MKRPVFQFYPKDWSNNSKLRFCSLAARGAWIELICLLHDSDEYGVLREPLAKLAMATGVPVKILRELVENGVLKGCDKGTCAPVSRTAKNGKVIMTLESQQGPIWYSSRMVNDEQLRMVRAAAGEEGAVFGERGGEFGALGGRPAVSSVLSAALPSALPPASSSVVSLVVAEGGFKTPLGNETRGDLKPGKEPPPAFASSSSATHNRFCVVDETGNPEGTGKPHERQGEDSVCQPAVGGEAGEGGGKKSDQGREGYLLGNPERGELEKTSTKPPADAGETLLAPLHNGDAFANAVARLYAHCFGLPVPPLSFRLRMSIALLREWHAPCATVGWWQGYWQVVAADDFLMGRRGLGGQPARRAAFAYLVSENCIARQRELNQRELARG